MRIIKVTDYDEVSVRTANMILGQVNLKPDAVLGLATGGSPVGAYKKIVEAYNNNEIDFSEVTTINLDEYRGIKRSHEQSYWSFMHENLFKHINVREDRIFIPNARQKLRPRRGPQFGLSERTYCFTHWTGSFTWRSSRLSKSS